MLNRFDTVLKTAATAAIGVLALVAALTGGTYEPIETVAQANSPASSETYYYNVRDVPTGHPSTRRTKAADIDLKMFVVDKYTHHVTLNAESCETNAQIHGMTLAYASGYCWVHVRRSVWSELIAQSELMKFSSFSTSPLPANPTEVTLGFQGEAIQLYLTATNASNQAHILEGPDSWELTRFGPGDSWENGPC